MASPTYTFSGGIAPASYTPNTESGLGSMIGKVAEQVIRDVVAKNPLAVFDKVPVANGDTIEQTVIKLANAQAYDSTGAGALTRKTPSMSVLYFKSWTRGKFETTVDASVIRKVLQTGKGVDEVASKLVGVLGESDKYEKYTQMKNLLKWGRQSADGGTGAVLVNAETVAYSSGIQYSKVLLAIKNAVSGMKFVNTSYNASSVNRSTRAEDIYILMPYKLKNEIDVEELAGVFNLDKADIRDKIIEIDSATESKFQYIYIVDRNAILNYTRLYEMAEQKNADGLFWNYFLHTERLYAICPLFDACYIKVGVEA